MNGRPDLRAGSTLVELLIAIVIGAAMLGVAGSLMSRVIASNSVAADHLRGVVALGTLAEQFRRDVHATVMARVEAADGQPSRLRLALADGAQVEYEIIPTGLRRAETAGGEPERREAFTLPAMRVVGFTADAAGSRAVSIRIGRLAGRPGDDVVSGEFEMTALVPRDGRTEAHP